MKLSEKYLIAHTTTSMPEGESWSAYEYDYLEIKHAKIYGEICALEAEIQTLNELKSGRFVQIKNRLNQIEKTLQ